MAYNRLIIGNNSRIVRAIASDILNAEFCSHTNFHEFELKKFDEIILFSWDHKSNKNIHAIINHIGCSKLVFVSTTAVLSLILRKQWSAYPNRKLEIESKVISLGGKILRIGVWDESLIKNSIGYVPVTSRNDLVDYINKPYQKKEIVETPVRIVPGTLSGYRKILAKFLYSISIFLPPLKYLQILIAAIAKSFSIASYSYTADSSKFFSNNLLLGYGVLGSTAHKIKRSQIDTVVVSPSPNIEIKDNGFFNTLIGKFNIGLSRFWHGVSIKLTNGVFYKSVPFFINRKRLPFGTLRFDISSLVHSNNKYFLYINTDKVHCPSFICNTLHIAAGALENCRLLQNISPVTCTFSDHEIGFFGICDPVDLISQKYLHRFGPFIYGRRIFTKHDHNPTFMLDFRPYNHKKANKNSNDLYCDTTFNILLKIIKKFSFFQFNEAFYNKFGFALYTNKISVFIQVEVRDSVLLTPYSKPIRNRLSITTYNGIQEIVSAHFPSFEADDAPVFFDAQHLLGGRQLLTTNSIQELINIGTLHIYGSPTYQQLGPFHHTQLLKEHISSISEGDDR